MTSLASKFRKYEEAHEAYCFKGTIEDKHERWEIEEAYKSAREKLLAAIFTIADGRSYGTKRRGR